MRAIAAEYQWLNQHYPGYNRIQQAFLKFNNRFYDRLTIMTNSGKTKVFFFDITRAVQQTLQSAGEHFATGTISRLSNTTQMSRPRIEILQAGRY